MTSHVEAASYGRLGILLAAAVIALGMRCDSPAKLDDIKDQSKDIQATATVEITRERAIEIARKELSFTPNSIDATKVTSDGPGHQRVWRVTFKGRLPDQPPELFETRIFEIDVRNGKIVSASIN